MKQNSIVTAVTKFLSYRIVNLLFPFLSISLISNKLTIDNLGVFFLCQGLSIWVSLVVDFGFIRHAVVAYKQTIRKKRSIFFTNVLSSQIILTFLATAFAVILYFLYADKLNIYDFLFFLTYGAFNGLVPKWYFQASGNMHRLALIECVVRLSFFLGLLGVLHFYNSFLIVELFYSLMVISIFATSIIFIANKGIHFNVTLIKLSEIKAYLADSLAVFYSRIAGNIYLNLNILVIGYVLTPKEVAIYGIAEKIVKAMSTILTSFGEALFPTIIRKQSSDSFKLKALLLKNSLIASLISIVPCILLFLLAAPIYSILFNSPSENAYVLKLMALSPLFYSISSVLSLHGLVSRGLYKAEFYCQVFVALVGFCTLYVAIIYFGITGAAYSYLLASFLSALVLLVANVMTRKARTTALESVA